MKVSEVGGGARRHRGRVCLLVCLMQSVLTEHTLSLSAGNVSASVVSLSHKNGGTQLDDRISQVGSSNHRRMVSSPV